MKTEKQGPFYLFHDFLVCSYFCFLECLFLCVTLKYSSNEIKTAFKLDQIQETYFSKPQNKSKAGA